MDVQSVVQKAAEEPMITEALMKWIVGGLVMAILGLVTYIRHLLSVIAAKDKERIERLEKDLERVHRQRSFVRSKTSAGEHDVLSKEEARHLAMAESQRFKLPDAIEVAKRKKMGERALKIAKLEAQLQEQWEGMQSEGLAP